MHAGTVVGVGHDRVVAVGSGDLSRVRDKDIGTKEIEGRVKVVVDQVHHVGWRASRVDPVNGAVEGNRDLVVRVLPGVLEVRENVRHRRDIGRVVDKGDNGLASIDHGTKRRPGISGQRRSAWAGRECLGRKAGGLECSCEGGSRLVVRVNDEDSDDIIRVRVDPGLDFCEVAFERAAVFELTAVYEEECGVKC